MYFLLFLFIFGLTRFLCVSHAWYLSVHTGCIVELLACLLLVLLLLLLPHMEACWNRKEICSPVYTNHASFFFSFLDVESFSTFPIFSFHLRRTHPKRPKGGINNNSWFHASRSVFVNILPFTHTLHLHTHPPKTMETHPHCGNVCPIIRLFCAWSTRNYSTLYDYILLFSKHLNPVSIYVGI